MQFWKSITSLQEKEFLKMFQVPVIEVPTNLPNIRKDLPIQAFAVVVFFFNIPNSFSFDIQQLHKNWNLFIYLFQHQLVCDWGFVVIVVHLST